MISVLRILDIQLINSQKIINFINVYNFFSLESKKIVKNHYIFTTLYIL